MDFMLDKLKLIEEKYTEIEAKMASPEVYNDPAAVAKLAREQKELTPVVDSTGTASVGAEDITRLTGD